MSPQREVVVKIPEKVVVHLRTVTQLAETASRYHSEIQVSAGGKSVNGKDVMDLLILLGPGHRELQIAAVGEDADSAIEALRTLVAEQLVEEGG